MPFQVKLVFRSAVGLGPKLKLSSLLTLICFTFFPSAKGWRCPLCSEYVGTFKQRKILASRNCPAKISLRDRVRASVCPAPEASCSATVTPSEPLEAMVERTARP
eukprot:1278810-Pyramimonas_sp.AAC.1